MLQERENMTTICVQNINQIQLAKQLRVTSQCINQWISGKRQPNLQMLKQLKQVLGCSYDELIEALLNAKEAKNKRGE